MPKGGSTFISSCMDVRINNRITLVHYWRKQCYYRIVHHTVLKLGVHSTILVGEHNLSLKSL